MADIFQIVGWGIFKVSVKYIYSNTKQRKLHNYQFYELYIPLLSKDEGDQSDLQVPPSLSIRYQMEMLGSHMQSHGQCFSIN